MQVVLIHGISTPSVSWKEIGPCLADHGFRVLIYGIVTVLSAVLYFLIFLAKRALYRKVFCLFFPQNIAETFFYTGKSPNASKSFDPDDFEPNLSQ